MYYPEPTSLEKEKSVEDLNLNDNEEVVEFFNNDDDDDAQDSSEIATAQHFNPQENEKSMDVDDNDSAVEKKNSNEKDGGGNESPKMCVDERSLSEDDSKSAQNNPLASDNDNNSNASLDKDHGGKRQIDGAKEPDDVATDIVDGKSMDKNDSSDVAAESDKEASKIADTLKTTETIEMDDADDENEDRGVRLRMDGIFEEEDDDEVVEIPNEESQTDVSKSINKQNKINYVVKFTNYFNLKLGSAGYSKYVADEFQRRRR